MTMATTAESKIPLVPIGDLKESFFAAIRPGYGHAR
jgi:hypothetical protein